MAREDAGGAGRPARAGSGPAGWLLAESGPRAFRPRARACGERGAAELDASGAPPPPNGPAGPASSRSSAIVGSALSTEAIASSERRWQLTGGIGPTRAGWAPNLVIRRPSTAATDRSPSRSYRSSCTSSHGESEEPMEATLLTKIQVDACCP